MAESIEQRATFELIRYANCWEDADVLCKALQPAPGKRILSIASGGDNSLALLAEGAEVVASDLSTVQLAVCELKVAAIRRLGHEECLGFLGFREGVERGEVFERLAGDLPAEVSSYWRGRPEAISAGIIHAGKFEAYFQLFRKRVLPWVHRQRTVESLLEARSAAERERYYEKRWNSWRWRLLFRMFFSRFMMGRLGRDPEFFRYVEGSVAERILERARHALVDLPTHENPYLEYILTGNFRNLPRYLRREWFFALKDRLKNLTLVRGSIQEVAKAHAGDGFDGFNLSDIFEYLDPDLCTSVYGALLEQARRGARFAYWNMLVPRTCPEALAGRVRYLEQESRELHAKDLAFFYGAFVVEEILAA